MHKIIPNLSRGDILWSSVSPTKHYYEHEQCYVVSIETICLLMSRDTHATTIYQLEMYDTHDNESNITYRLYKFSAIYNPTQPNLARLIIILHLTVMSPKS